MTKVFITIPWFLPAFRAGGPIQSVANMVREFTEEVEYYIFCGDTDITGAQLEEVETGKWIQFNAHTKVWYSRPEKISDNLVKQVELQKPGILFIIGLFSWHYNIVPIIFCKGPVKILSARGMLHPGALSQKKWKKKIFLQVFKLLELHHKIAFHATDEEEMRFIANHFGSPAKVHVAGNFPNRIPVLPLPQKEAGSLKLVSITLISPMKNILQVLTALQEVTSRVDYIIYGPVKDEDYWNACRQKIKLLPPHITVTCAGEIKPTEVSEALAAAHCFILPSKSENFGHALYEALSAGRPVITSDRTPWNHLRESEAGINVQAEDVYAIGEAIEFFAGMEEATFSRWHEGAASYAARAIDVEKTKKEFKSMFGLHA